MKYLILILCMAFLCSGCVLFDSIRSGVNAYDEEAVKATKELKELYAAGRIIKSKITSGKYGRKEVVSLTAQAFVIWEKIEKLSDIKDSANDKRKKSKRSPFADIIVALIAVGGAIGGVWAIPGKYLRLAEP